MNVLLVHPRVDERWISMDRYTQGLVNSAPSIQFNCAPANFLDPPEIVRTVVPRYRYAPQVRETFNAGSFDIGHVTAHWIGHHHRWMREAGTVVTCHDVTELLPGCSSFRPGWDRALNGTLLRYSFRTIGAADVVIGVSNATRRRLIEYGIAEESRIHVVYPALYPAFVDAPDPHLRLPALENVVGPKVLSVGNGNQHKNLAMLVEAMAAPGLRGATLVRVGHPMEQPLRELAVRHRVADRIVELGRADDATLLTAYAAADVVVMPSKDEGFGYPAAEGMALGAPVVCSDGGALPEVVGDAGVVVPLGANDSDTAVRFGEAIEAVLSDSRARATMVSRGRKRARLFTPGAVGPALLDAYAAALSSRAGRD